MSKNSTNRVASYLIASLAADRLGINVVISYLLFYCLFSFERLTLSLLFIVVLGKLLFFPFDAKRLNTQPLGTVIDLSPAIEDARHKYRVPALTPLTQSDIKKRFSEIEVELWDKPSFRDASLLFRRVIFAPTDVRERSIRSKDLTLARLMHDVAHTEYKDRLTSNVFMAGLFMIAPQVSFPPAYFDELSPGSYIIWLPMALWCVLVFRALDFFHVRKFRADIFSYNIVGDSMVEYLRRMTRRERRTRIKGRIARFLAGHTHPTFGTRHIRLTACIPDYENCPQVKRWATRAVRHSMFANAVLIWQLSIVWKEINLLRSDLSYHSGLNSEFEIQCRITIYFALFCLTLFFGLLNNIILFNNIRPIWVQIKNDLTL